MGIEFDDRRVRDCPFRQVEKAIRSHQNSPKIIINCSNPEHGRQCTYDGKVALWKCKFGSHKEELIRK